MINSYIWASTSTCIYMGIDTHVRKIHNTCMMCTWHVHYIYVTCTWTCTWVTRKQSDMTPCLEHRIPPLDKQRTHTFRHDVAQEKHTCPYQIILALWTPVWYLPTTDKDGIKVVLSISLRIAGLLNVVHPMSSLVSLHFSLYACITLPGRSCIMLLEKGYIALLRGVTSRCYVQLEGWPYFILLLTHDLERCVRFVLRVWAWLHFCGGSFLECHSAC